MSNAAAVHRKAAELGKLTLRMTALAGAGHPSSGLSLAHLVVELLYRQMRYDPADPWNPGADRLVLSEGHAVPMVYAAYADIGGVVGKSREAAKKLTVKDLDALRATESVLDGHPNPAEGFPFFDAATGSLGQGLSVAAGLALAARVDKLDRRIYCIVGDGESREGQIWEAVDFLVDHKLTRVCMIFNCNAQGQAGYVSAQQSPESLAAKLTAFGCEVVTIDGHDPHAIAGAFAKFGINARPLAIVAKTVKGWGVEELQKGNWHGKPLKESELEAACASLDRTVAALGAASAPALSCTAPKPAAASTPRPAPREAQWPTLGEALRGAKLESAYEKRMLATRRAYGVALETAGRLLPQVVCLDGDVSNSTFSEIFAKAHPERFFECKIAEQNMISAAAGLAAAGLIPFANSFAKFIARGYDQVELANISRANLKIVGSHAGITPSSDGPSQMGLLDVAFFRAFTTVTADNRRDPLCWLFQPADAVAAWRLTRLMIELPGMCYMRTFRPDVPFLYDEGAKFEPGGFGVLRSGDDLALISAGYMTHVALQVADQLAKQSIRAAVIDAYCLPVDRERLIETIQRSSGRALVIEDNYGGGLGAAVAELCAATGRMRCESAHVNRVPKSTRQPEEELVYCGVGPGQLADRALAFLKRVM